MGRKIKGKKHHGTKDPEKQQQRRMEAIKMKVGGIDTVFIRVLFFML
jgi:hypothetical protein